jgi:hypothetical protein
MPLERDILGLTLFKRLQGSTSFCEQKEAKKL